MELLTLNLFRVRYLEGEGELVDAVAGNSGAKPGLISC